MVKAQLLTVVADVQVITIFQDGTGQDGPNLFRLTNFWDKSVDKTKGGLTYPGVGF